MTSLIRARRSTGRLSRKVRSSDFARWPYLRNGAGTAPISSRKHWSWRNLPRATARSLILAIIYFYTTRSEEHTSELQSLRHLVCRLLLEKKKETSAGI